MIIVDIEGIEAVFSNDNWVSPNADLTFALNTFSKHAIDEYAYYPDPELAKVEHVLKILGKGTITYHAGRDDKPTEEDIIY